MAANRVKYNTQISGGWSGGNAIIKVPWLCSCRSILALVSFLGFINVYALRVNMSVAMVCMINHTAVQMDFADSVTLNRTHSLSNHDNQTLTSKTDVHYSYGDYDNINNSSHSENVESAGSYRKQDGEYNWGKTTQALILGSFFWGYLLTQIPGGWLAVKFGGKRIFGWSMFICSLATLLIPLGAELHPIMLIILRTIIGMSQGAVYPAINAVWSYWAPPLERSRLMAFTLAGAHLGNVLTFPVSGLLCEYGFGRGWPSIFYILGSLGILWFIIWMLCVHDTPEQHPRISNQEKVYIQNSLAGQNSIHVNRKVSIPYTSMVKSSPVWAVIVALSCGAWLEYSFLTNMPTYLDEILHFDITQNGFASSLPYVGVWIITLVSGVVADELMSRKLLNATKVRKLNVAVGMLLSAIFCVAIGYVKSSQWILSVALLTATISALGSTYGAGYFINYVDIAPKFASILFAVANTIASIPGFVAPYIISVITVNQTQEEWRIVFYITAILLTVGCVFYLVFGSGELQFWATDSVNTNNAVLERVVLSSKLLDNNNQNDVNSTALEN